MEIRITWICDMSTRGFLTEILLHIYKQCAADKVSLAFYSLLLLTNYENI